MDAEQIITKLDQLEYFKYLPEEKAPKFKDLLKEQINSGWLNMPNQHYFDDDHKGSTQKPTSIDRRSVHVDGVSIFRGELETTLNEFKPIFESRNLKFEIQENREEYSGDNNEYLKHTITVNKSDYLIFDGVPERGLSEMEYLKSLFNLLKEELKKQQYTSERFTVLTSIETLYFILIDIETIAYVETIGGALESKIIDLNAF